MKINRQQVAMACLYILFFFISIRFLNRNNTWIVLFSVMTMAIVLIKQRIICIPNEWIPLIIFSVVYCVVGEFTTSLASMIIYGIGASVMYVIGYNILSLVNEDEREKNYMRFVYIATFSNVLFMLLSYVRYGVSIDIGNGIDNRYVGDFWTGEWFYCTNFNSYGALVCILAFFVMMQNYKTIYKLITLVCLIGSVIVSLATGSRTILYLFLLSIPMYFICSFLYHHRTDNRDGEENHGQRYLFIIMVCLVGGVVLVMAWEWILSVLPLDTLFQRLANISNPFSLEESGRLSFWREVIALISEYPWGGMRYEGYAHNFILDVIRVAGIIPGIALTLFLISTEKTAITILKCDYLQERTRIIAPIFVTLLIVSFMIEPVMEAKPYVFITFCFLCGMNRGLVETKSIALKV